jgi:hypothetical protein
MDHLSSAYSLKLLLHEPSRETIQVGRLPIRSYLSSVNVYLPEIKASQLLISGRQTFTLGAGSLPNRLVHLPHVNAALCVYKLQ